MTCKKSGEEVCAHTECAKPENKQDESVVALSDVLCDVEVNEEKTLSGWVQPYVSLRVGNFEFKRNYQTMRGAENCVNKIREMLRQERAT